MGIRLVELYINCTFRGSFIPPFSNIVYLLVLNIFHPGCPSQQFPLPPAPYHLVSLHPALLQPYLPNHSLQSKLEVR